MGTDKPPREVGITPTGARTSWPQDFLMLGTILGPAIYIFFAFGYAILIVVPDKGSLSDLWLVVGAGACAVGIGLASIPALSPGRNGSLLAAVCRKLAWVNALFLLPGVLLLIGAIVTASDGLQLALLLFSGGLPFLFALRTSLFYRGLSRALNAAGLPPSARPGSYPG